MLDFFFFMLILLGFVAGSSLIYVLLTRLSRRIEPGGEGPSLALLREEMDSLQVRLGRVEEELEFYRQLMASDEGEPPERLPAPRTRDPRGFEESSP